MAELDVALVNAALANRTPGVRAARIEVVERFVAQGTNVARIGLVPDSGSSVRLPRTMIAKWTVDAAHLPEVRSEIETHLTVLATMPDAPSPACFGTLVREEDHTALLLTRDLAVDHDRPAAPVDSHVLTRIVDAVAGVHAAWWDGAILADDRFTTPMPRPTRMPQAAPARVIRANAAVIQEPIQRFLMAHDHELTAFEKRLLPWLADRWGELFLERIRDGRLLTLIHGDLHLRGNVFVHRATGAIRFIDWADCKPGLGPHDVAYCLISAETADRKSRDIALLRRYHGRLGELGITGYPWALCLWDYRFALLSNLLQSVLQDSLAWHRKTSAIAAVWECDLLLGNPD